MKIARTFWLKIQHLFKIEGPSVRNLCVRSTVPIMLWLLRAAINVLAAACGHHFLAAACGHHVGCCVRPTWPTWCARAENGLHGAPPPDKVMQRQRAVSFIEVAKHENQSLWGS